MCTEWNPCEGHLPAVQISGDGYRGHRHLTCHDIISRVCRDHSLWCQLDAGIKVYGLLYVLLVARRTIIYILGIIADAIVESEVPRY